MKASTLEKINGRMAREIAQLKRNVHVADNALQAAKRQNHEITVEHYEERDKLYTENFGLRNDIRLLQAEIQNERTAWRQLAHAIHHILTYPYYSAVREACLDWYAVRRLGAARRDAIELNGIELVKMARRYWDWDQNEARTQRNNVRKSTGRFQQLYMDFHKRWLT